MIAHKPKEKALIKVPSKKSQQQCLKAKSPICENHFTVQIKVRKFTCTAIGLKS